MSSSRVGLAAALIGVAGVVAVTVALWSQGGLPSHPVSSVPELLSEPAGLPEADLILAPDGLGPVTFGETDADVVAELTGLLGDPVEDAPQPCPSEEHLVRTVRWGNLSIGLPGGEFAGYVSGIYFPPDSPEVVIETAEGVGPRSTVAQMLGAYGDRFAWLGVDSSGFGSAADIFGIDGYDLAHPSPSGLGGLVEGGRDSGRVITVVAGMPCGPGS